MTGSDRPGEGAAAPDLEARVRVLEDQLATLQAARELRAGVEMLRYGYTHQRLEPDPSEPEGFFSSLPEWLQRGHC